MKKFAKFIICFIPLVVGVVFFSLQFKNISALGYFFAPYYGIWSHFIEAKDQNIIKIGKYSQEASIYYDERRVPHVFSKDTNSAYFAFGYATAKDRLFQMTLMSRAAEGRVSEIVGSPAVSYDKMMREVNLKQSAHKLVLQLEENPKLKNYIYSYIEGVNYYINSLTVKTMPWEFLLLDIKPALWRPLDTALIYQQINWTLSKKSTALEYQTLLSKVGIDKLNDLFPYFSSYARPVFENPSAFQNAFVKKVSEVESVKNLDEDVKSLEEDVKSKILNNNLGMYQDRPSIDGSNNFVLSGKKTENGYPMLANDPHLELSLPSVWYEGQIFTDEINVYGVTLPGIPFIAIGFNKNIAWGITNGSDNAVDFYSVKTRLYENGESEFYNGSKWEPLPYRTEYILVKNSSPISYKIYESPLGSIMNMNGDSSNSEVPKGSLMKWAGAEPGKEFDVFYSLNKAENYTDFTSAISKHVSPSFNFAFAAKNGDIALWHQGKFELRETPEHVLIKNYENISNNSNIKYISFENNPHSLNPDTNFLSSANQQPVSKSYPNYFPGKYESYSRPNRINEVLSTLSSVNVKNLMQLQNDNYNIYAKDFINLFYTMIFIDQDFSLEEKNTLNLLKSWDCVHASNSIEASIFTLWQNKLDHVLWKNLMYQPNGKFNTLPSYEKNLDLFKNINDKLWFTSENLNSQLTYKQALISSFKETFSELKEKYGYPVNKKWEYRNIFEVSIPNLAKIPGFGEERLFVGGSIYSPNAINKSHGPSWRMVVSFHKDGIEAFGALPGGNSGNPASPFYLGSLSQWEKGEYFPLNFMLSEPEKNSLQFAHKITIF